MDHCKSCGTEFQHCSMCGKQLTQEDPGRTMTHNHGYGAPVDFIHCKVCETKYFPGPWYVEVGNASKHWYIRNAITGRHVKIGKVQLKGINYYERAREECGRRNLALDLEVLDGILSPENPKK